MLQLCQTPHVPAPLVLQAATAIVLQSSPNAAEGCPSPGWSPALGYSAHPIGLSFSINASSGETVPVQAQLKLNSLLPP